MMKQTKLTQRTCEAVVSGNSTNFAWDSELKGFGLRVTPTGAKAFVVQYRAGYGRSGQTRRMTIGRYGDGVWTVDAARREAKRILGNVAAGGDPLQELRVKRDELRVSELLQLYFAEGCVGNKERTLRYDRARAESHIKPLIGSLTLTEVTRAKIEKMMIDIADGKTAAKSVAKPRPPAVVRGGKSAANRAVAMLQGAFTFAKMRDLMSFNPATGVKRFKESHKERFLTSKELARFGAALTRVEEDGANPKGVAIIRLLALTGARRNEIASLAWEDLDLEREIIMLGDSKTGKKAFPIAPAAMLILSRIASERGSPFVFPAGRGHSHYVGEGKLWEKVRNLADLNDVRLHDLRHTFASFGAGVGFGLPVIGAILGHKSTSTTARYAHLANDPVKQAVGRIGSTIAAHMTTKLPTQKAL